MRKLIVLLFAVFACNAHAQLWEHAYQPSEYVHYDQVLPVGGGRWAVAGRADSQDHMIRVYNNDGSVAWEVVGPYAGDGDRGQVVSMPDSGLLCVGGYDGCAYFGPESRVRRYASDGTILWEREIYPLIGAPLTMAAKGSMNHVAVASPDSVYIMDLDGNVTGGFPVPLSEYVNHMVWASDSSLFMGRGMELMLVGMDGTQLASVPVGYVEDMHWDGNQLFVLSLSDDSVRRYDPNLQLLGSSFFPEVDYQTTNRFITSGNSLYVNTADGLYELDPDGNPSLTFPWPELPGLVTAGCAIRDSTVLVVGNTDISERSTGIIRTLSISGEAAQHDEDVEVQVEVGSTWAEFTGSPSYPWDWKADVTGLVVNHGTDTLRSVVLSMWVSIPIDFAFCGLPANRIDTIGLALAPSDTVSLPFGEVDVSLGNAYGGGQFEICIVALAPDQLADRAPDDNTACTTADFPLGIEGMEGYAPLSVFPNPVADACTVSGLATLGAPVRLRVLDLAGRIVSERSGNASGNNLELNVSGLPAGTYFLRAEGPTGRAVLKLAVTRP